MEQHIHARGIKGVRVARGWHQAVAVLCAILEYVISVTV